jgi:muramoyltetrapeptide carboxypeptidase
MRDKKMGRRGFLKRAGLAAPLLLGNPSSAFAMSKTPSTRNHLIKPARLCTGDVIGIVAPASPANGPDDVDSFTTALIKLGFQPKLSPNIHMRLGYLAGDDQSRASDLMGMFADNSVKAIMCARGGYGSGRLLQALDYKFIKRHPKIFIGFSDITALHCAIQTHSRLVTFHGPTLNTSITEGDLSDFSLQCLLKTVTKTSAPGGICDASTRKAVNILQKGTATGPLIGGNLSVFCNLVGTPYQPRFKGAIFFFEDVNEKPYRFDGRLTQLLNAGLLQQVAGVAVGTNRGCVDPDAAKLGGSQQSLEDVLRDRLLPLGVPVLMNLPFGHVRDNATLPVGLQATLDAENGDLIVNEPAVI